MTESMNVRVFAQMVRDSGLDVKKESDMKLWQQALDEYTGNDINADLPQILARAASKKPGTEILQAWNDAHAPADTSPTPRQAADIPQANRPGIDILDELNRSNPL